MIGQKISHFEILEKLGEGGMGVVYKARDLKLDRFVALKFLPPQLGAKAQEKKRFVHEAKAASALDHPNVATIYEIDETDDGQLYIAMAHYEGETLKGKIDRGQLSLPEAVDITLQVAHGLAKVHKQGIVHRDIKPANIIVSTEGEVKIVDFGLAMLTMGQQYAATGKTLGTLSYISPEQVRGDPVDHRSDIWSLGVILYEMLTGQPPFKAEYDQVLMHTILHETYPPADRFRPKLPAVLTKIINRCLQKNPANRYASVKDLIQDLAHVKQQIAPTRPLIGPKPWLFLSRKHKFILWPAVVVILAFLALMGRQVLLENPSQIDSIAVIPFANINGDETTEYLTDGIAESINISLSRLQNLKVIATSSARRYKGQTIDPQSIGEKLGVHTVLTGKGLQRDDDELLFTVELADTRDNSLIWGKRYSRNLSEIFRIQEDILTDIANELQLHLTAEEKERLVKTYTESGEAYRLYLKGRYFWNQRTKEGFEKAIACFEQALEKDPQYAIAYVGLADTYTLLSNYGYLSPQEAFPKAKSAVVKALDIDNKLAQAHNSLATISFLYDWDFSTAEREFRRAIALNPSYATAYQIYAYYLSVLARSEEAIRAIERAATLDPFSSIIHAVAGRIHYFAGRYDLALEQYLKTVELDPDFWLVYSFLGQAYVQQNRYSEGIQALKKAVALSGDNPIAIGRLGHAYTASGNKEAALRILDQMIDLERQGTGLSYQIAVTYAGLGEDDQCFEWLEKAYEQRHDFLLDISVDPRLENLHSDPRFYALLERMGFE